MTDISREEALAHFGVKGQKWGVRNERRANAARALVDSKKQKIERGKQARENRPRPLKNASPATKKKVAIGATIAIGTVAATAILASKGKQKMISDINKAASDVTDADMEKYAQMFKDAYNAAGIDL